MKTCRKCSATHPETPAFWYKGKKGFTSPCKPCRLASAKVKYDADPDRYREANKARRAKNLDAYRESARRNRAENRESINAKQREAYASDRKQRAAAERARRAANPEHARALDRQRRERNPEKFREQARSRSAANRDYVNARQRGYRQADPDRFREYDAARYATPHGNLNRRVSASIVTQLRKMGQRKTLPKALITGWTIADLTAHLESLFEDGMSFDSYGDWEIDHIIPLAKIPFAHETDPLFRRAWSLSNLAPLWGFDNHQKNDRLDWVLPASYVNSKLRKAYENRDLTLLTSTQSGLASTLLSVA